MKKCPFCKADIEDNARFCLYCMKPLTEKEVVAHPKGKKRWWLALLIGAMAVALIVIFLFAGGENGGDTAPKKTGASETTKTTEATPAPSPEADISTNPAGDSLPPADDTPNEPIEDTLPPTDSTEDTSPAEPTEDASPPNPTEDTPPPDSTEDTTLPKPCDHSYTLSDSRAAGCTADGFNTYTCNLCLDTYQEALPAIGHSYTPATCLTPKVCKVCSQTDGEPLNHNYLNGFCSRCNAPDSTVKKVSFTYQEDSNGDLVITGVQERSPDGVYEIPSHIDGKRVVGIMPLAFSGTDAREITLGENIRRVNQNAFAGCVNIEALYVKSDSLFLSRSAFVDASRRNCTLKIYCSASCTVDDDLLGTCYLKDIAHIYGGEYHQL